MPIGPCQELENTIRIITRAFRYANVPYWLSFGALWGLVKNDGIIPDDDIDICTFHGQDYLHIAKALESFGYHLHKTLISDVDGKALYCSYSSTPSLIHICLSFWYLHDGVRYYCHDQLREVEDGAAVPKSGFWFRGVPAHCVDGENRFRDVEWPGINQQYKIVVPRFPGEILDHMYPDWAWQKQKYEIDRRTRVVNKAKTVSVYKGGASSPYAVHVESMKQWNDARYIENQLKEGRKQWNIKLKTAV